MGKTIITGEIDLSGVSANYYKSSDPINIDHYSVEGNFNLWSQISGDPGATGSGVSIIWDGNFHNTSGTTYWVIPSGTAFIRESGTSINGPKSNSIDANTFSPDIFPWMRIKARHNGSATTSTAKVNFALIFE